MTDPDCVFCKIVAGDIPADIVYETDSVTAFRDISPRAPTHVLIIPKEHIVSLEACNDEQIVLLGPISAAARDIARAEGIAGSGYRTVVNTGGDGGQAVEHLHMHLLGGRPMEWPPG